MSEYMFGITRVRVSNSVAKKLDAICKAEGGTGFTGPVSFPGNDIRGWFTGPNLGSPFDKDLSNRVQNAIVKANLDRFIWPDLDNAYLKG